jgi:hypothetical protein
MVAAAGNCEGRRCCWSYQNYLCYTPITVNYTSMASPRPVEKEYMWKKPPPDAYKLNNDALFHPDGSGAVGMVLRNDHGGICLSYKFSTQSDNS